MADNYYSMSLIGAMDRLWFHQIILLCHEPISLIVPKILEKPQAISKSLITCPSSTQSLSALPDEQISEAISSSFLSSPITTLDELIKKEEEEEKEVNMKVGRVTRWSLSSSSTRSLSSSPLTQKPPRSLRHRVLTSSTTKLEKSMSCRSLGELELEEVKGFMDLGFTFKKEHLSPRMMSVVPGLQRLGFFKSNLSNTTKLITNDDEIANKDDDIISAKDEEEEEMRGDIIRPYLSEAWLIKRPDSPLLNMKVPRVFTANDMNKHLRFWARTVASVIHQ